MTKINDDEVSMVNAKRKKEEAWLNKQMEKMSMAYLIQKLGEMLDEEPKNSVEEKILKANKINWSYIFMN